VRRKKFEAHGIEAVVKPPPHTQMEMDRLKWRLGLRKRKFFFSAVPKCGTAKIVSRIARTATEKSIDNSITCFQFELPKKVFDS